MTQTEIKKFFKRRIFLDIASGTDLDKSVLSCLYKEFKIFYPNSSALNSWSQNSRDSLVDLRERMARAWNCKAQQIIFTSSATESNNLALSGSLKKIESNYPNEKLHLISSALEHKSVSGFFDFQKNRHQVSLIKIKNGILDLEDFKAQIKPQTVLISFSLVSSEIGVIQPISKISKILNDLGRDFFKFNRPILHIDCGNLSPILLNCSPQFLGADLISLDSRKIYGPGGVGALFARDLDLIEPVFFGGEQEFSKRPGTEPINLIAAFVLAFEIVIKNRVKKLKLIEEKYNYFISQLKLIKGFKLNPEKGIFFSMIINCSFWNNKIGSEYLILKLSEYGIYLNSKSACFGHQKNDSEVLKSFLKNLPPNSIRISFDDKLKKSEIDYTVKILKRIIENEK